MKIPTRARRRAAAATTVALVCSVALVVPQTAEAAAPCSMKVKTSLKRTVNLAGGASMKRYVAHVNDPASTKYDQSAHVILTSLPVGVAPRLTHVALGSRAGTGTMVTSQFPRALAGVNGDFFTQPTIRSKSVTLARGPMVADGVVLRGSHDRMRTVGVTRSGLPFAGPFGIRGWVRLGTDPTMPVNAVNWESLAARGVTIYTPDWSRSSSAPRPAGAAEWVIDASKVIKQVRTSSINAGKLGAGVSDGTRVVAFPPDLAASAGLAKAGDHVSVSVRQTTKTGAALRTALGRGLTLVDNGVAAPLDCASYVTSARPRTVVGWTADGQWRVLTVPGTEFVGVGLRVGGFGIPEVANVAEKLGLVNAYELDGGGSTTLYTRKASTWTRHDLWGVTGGTYERPVTNGLAFLPN
ncbi:MAG: phosphodiester glycosidase family protein [Actinomycetes bacterium]